jgi:hypothetical protein
LGRFDIDEPVVDIYSYHVTLELGDPEREGPLVAACIQDPRALYFLAGAIYLA